MARGSVAKIDQFVYRSALFPPLRVRTTRASTHPYAEHFHEAFSIGVVFKGKTRLRCPDGAITVGAGQIVVFAPLEPHSCNPVGGNPRGYHMFYLDAGWLEQTRAGGGDRFAVVRRVLSEPDLFDAMMRLADAIENNRAFAQWQNVLERIVHSSCAADPQKTHPASSPALAVFQEQNNETNAPGESRMAARLGVERETFIRSFRRATGMTPGRYRQCLRLARALRALGDGDSIVHAAMKGGYFDQSHFHRMCVKYLSATPSQLRLRAASHLSKT